MIGWAKERSKASGLSAVKKRKKFPVYAVIMAGGRGTRFWPLSRETLPKQFLRITGQKTMIEEAVERLLPWLPYSRILTISDGALAKLVRRHVPGLLERNILVEPEGKNTAASLILGTATLYLRNPRSVVAVLCADHVITKKAVFLRKLEAAMEAAAEEEAIVTFGIPPAYPATGYGYIQVSRRNAKKYDGERFYPVVRFKEKPGLKKAKEFVADGQHFWNSGMFVWRADVFARKLEKYAPVFYGFWERILAALRERRRQEIKAVFREIPAMSIDYALMEKAKGVLMNRGDFGWSDVGAWSSVAQFWPKDKFGNALFGRSLVVDSSGCIVYGSDPRKLTAIAGLKDIIIVDTKDALLVCRKDKDQRVKDIVKLLR